MIPRLIAIVLIALFAPLPLAACEKHAGGPRAAGDQIVLVDGNAAAGTAQAVSTVSSCCGTAACECAEVTIPACGHQQPLSGTACLCGCTDIPRHHVPVPVNSSARAELSKVLVRAELVAPLLLTPEPRPTIPGREPVLRPGAEQLFLLNLSFRT